MKSRALLLAAALSLAIPMTAAAADPPSNDLIENATVIGSLPFSETLDTTGATTDSVDEEANAQCGAPATEASVWYDLTPDTGDTYSVDVSQSDFEAGVLVAVGDPGSLTVVSCGPFYIEFWAEEGIAYHIMAFSDTPGVNGGQLNITVDRVPPPPEITVEVQPVGTISRSTGLITFNLNVTCSEPAFIDVYAELRQRAGRVYVLGYGGGGGECTDSAQLQVFVDQASANGIFVGGPASLTVDAYSYRPGPPMALLAPSWGFGPGVAPAATPGGEVYFTVPVRLKPTR